MGQRRLFFSSSIEVLSTNKIIIYLACTTRWLDVPVHCEMIPRIKLIDTHPSPHTVEEGDLERQNVTAGF